jgi:acyl carrier protein
MNISRSTPITTMRGLCRQRGPHSHCQASGRAIERVTDEAHFTDDFKADWLDRLELMIVIEDQFSRVEITDGDVDHIEVVGDLIRHVESMESKRRPSA